MSTEEYRASDEIEGEIEHTRTEMRETLDAIQNRFTPGQMMDDVMSYFREGPGAFASNLGRIARDNPIPLALVGTGLAWLALSGGRRRSRDYDEGDDESRYDYASAGGGDYVAATGAEYAAYTAAGGARHPASVGAAYDPGGESAGSAHEPYEPYEYEPYGDEQQGRVGRMRQGARERMTRIGGMARDQGQRARAGFTEMMDEQPLLMAAAAFVLGAALGALLPATRREDRLVGDTRDELMHRATEMGREGLGRAERTAGETWTAVSDEALNRESASGSEASAGPAERKAEDVTERTGTRRSTASSTRRSAAGGGSNVSPGAAGTTPSEGDKKKG